LKRILLVCTSILLLGPVQAGHAAEHVITIYFGGTGLVEQGYNGSLTRWDTPSLLSEMHLNHKDQAGNQHKLFIPGVGARKYLSNPDGSTGPADHCRGNPKELFPIDLVSQAFRQQKESHKPICRNWKFTVNEAGEKLTTLKDELDLQSGDTMILNVIGHSRGAIAAMWFLHDGFTAGKIRDETFLDEWSTSGELTAVNLVILEPVPGIDLLDSDFEPIEKYDTGAQTDPLGHDPMSWDTFRLDGRIEKVVAIYAEDERSNLFGAVLPYIPRGTDTLMFRVRGGHQTMVGSLWRDGHAPQSFPILCPAPYTDPNLCDGAEHISDLIAVNNAVAITLIEVLGGPGWGGVTFSNWSSFLERSYGSEDFGGNDETRKSLFGSQVSTMRQSSLSSYYRQMRRSSYFPGPLWPTGLLLGLYNILPPVPLEEYAGGNCERIWWQWEGVFKPWSLNSHYTRCMERVFAPGVSPGHATRGLKYLEIPELTTGSTDPFNQDVAWDAIAAMREVHLDTGPELVAEANGPYILECSSPAQEEEVQLDSSGSIPGPGGTALEYKWGIFGGPEVIEIQGSEPEHANPLVSLGMGEYDVYLFTDDHASDVPGKDQTWINIEDTQGPVVTCPDDLVVECTGPSGAAASFADVTAVDACHAASVPECSAESGATFPIGENYVACTSYDYSPDVHHSQCLFRIDVFDGEPPVITGFDEPVSFPLSLDIDHTVVRVADLVSGVTDNCSVLTLDDLTITQVTRNVSTADSASLPASGFLVAGDGKSVDLAAGEYLVEVQVGDPSDNTTTRIFEVHVLSPLAVFEVTKDFSDDNPASVGVDISCNSGLPLTQSAEITETGEGFRIVTFTVKGFVHGDTDCTITETLVPGYTAGYVATGASAMEPDPDNPACRFVGVSYGERNFCAIGNTLQATPWRINVLWEGHDRHGVKLLPSELEVTCENVLEGGTGEPGTFTDTVALLPDASPYEYLVYPTGGEPASRCSAVAVSESRAVEFEQGCADWQPIEIGDEEASCTITATWFFEGIPVLDHYHMALMILLLFGIGAVAIRRIA
jgi:hypothetical protein